MTMTVAFVAAFVAVLLALASVLRKNPTIATWSFAAGMTALGADALFTGFALGADDLEQTLQWLTRAAVAKSFVPLGWLAFSLTYSRGDASTFLRRWKIALGVAALLPVTSWLGTPLRLVDTGGQAPQLLFSDAGKLLNGALLLASVLILTNIEQTFRASVGTMRWRIKFVLVALAVIFGSRIYVRTQALLFSAPDLGLIGIEPLSVLIGCVCFVLAYTRSGWKEIDVYPSLAILRSSVTVVVVGLYLFLVGVVAQLARRFGGAEYLQFQAIVVFGGMAGLIVLLLSDRVRQGIQRWAVRHFRRSEHDALRVWTQLSGRLATVSDRSALCAAAARSVSETFEALSVNVWLVSDGEHHLSLVASTQHGTRVGEDIEGASAAVSMGLSRPAGPFDLDALSDEWAVEFRQLNPVTFAHGGRRLCVPLRAAGEPIGALVLSDRVNGADYSVEELDLIRCIGAQITSVMWNLRLAAEVGRAREFEAFRTVSAFFVHDLKNAAASLNLMLNNLPVHFDDPAFRADALRAVGNTARRIDDMITRFNALRHVPDLRATEADLNQIVAEALRGVGELPAVKLTADLRPLPPILADREQVQSVVTNLVLNARDALSTGGAIQVRTSCEGDCVVVSVADNGCGMSRAFVRESLFRPFQSTKAKGLGIGLFQSRRIVEAHGGQVSVESEPGRGTTFRVMFPPKAAR